MQLELSEALPSVGTEPWLVHTDVFDGPLDLLLYLVRRDGIDLKNLPVSEIAEAYLTYLSQMQELNLSMAGDYLVMAATLVHLKALGLLPRRPTAIDETEVDPRLELQERLEAYQRVKQAADALEQLPRVGRDVHVRAPHDADRGARPFEPGIDAFGLLDLLFELIKRGEAPEPTVVLADEGPDIEGCCRRLLAALRARDGAIELTSVLRALPTRSERVVTFVAALEMTRLGWLDVQQEHHLGPVVLSRRVSDDAMELSLITGRFDDADADEDGQIALPLASAQP